LSTAGRDINVTAGCFRGRQKTGIEYVLIKIFFCSRHLSLPGVSVVVVVVLGLV